MTVLKPLNPTDVASRLSAGKAVLVDIREPGEFAAGHIAGAVSQPLSAFEAAHLTVEPGRDVIFMCRSGMRTAANCDRLAASVRGTAFVLRGGLNEWASLGLPVVRPEVSVADVTRQQYLLTGMLILAGLVLGARSDVLWYLLPAAVGAGQIVAALTGFCLMRTVLSAMPWNRRAVG